MADPTRTADPIAGLAEVFLALSSPTRLRVLARLRQGPSPVTALAEELGIGQASLSNQLRILRHARLVAGDRDGRTVSYRLYDDHVKDFFDQALLHLRHT